MKADPAHWEQQGRQAWEAGELRQAVEAFARAAAAYRAQGDEVAALRMEGNRAVALLFLNQVDEALRLLSPLPQQLEALQNPREAALAWGNLGLALERAGRAREAQEAYLRSLTLMRAFPDMTEEKADVYRGLARLAFRRGHGVQALRMMARAVYLAPRNLLERLMMYALRPVAPVLFEESQP